MKKAMVFTALALVFVLSLASCDSLWEEPEASSTVMADYGLGDIAVAAGLERGTVFSTLDDESKAALKAEAERLGATVSYTDDGSTLFTYIDGRVVTQYADGTVSYRDGGVTGESANAQVNSDWPDNEYTAKLPVPALTVQSTSLINGKYNVTFADADMESVKAYSEQLKSAGYSVDLSLTDEEGMYIFSASNAAGDSVKLTAAGGTATLRLTVAD